ncbi:MAG: hypothetical protein ACRC50_01535, partial [Gaiella sp.]
GSTGEALALARSTLEQLTPGMQPALFELAAGELVVAFTDGRHQTELRTLLDRVVTDTTWRRDRSQRIAAFVRGALALEEYDLAARLCEGAVPRWPIYRAVLVSAEARLAEARGELAHAVEQYAVAAESCRTLGLLLEEGYAVLGQGRCLAALGDPGVAPTLRHARELFTEMGARTRLRDCDMLLAAVARRSS